MQPEGLSLWEIGHWSYRLQMCQRPARNESRACKCNQSTIVCASTPVSHRLMARLHQLRHSYAAFASHSLVACQSSSSSSSLRSCRHQLRCAVGVYHTSWTPVVGRRYHTDIVQLSVRSSSRMKPLQRLTARPQFDRIRC